MFCPKCGTMLDDNVRFCGGCGYQFPQPEEQEIPVETEQAFFTPEPPQQAPAPIPQAAPTPQPIPPTGAQTPMPQPPKKSGVTTFLAVLLILVIIGSVAAALLFVYPGWLNEDDDDDSSSKKAKDSSSVSQVDSDDDDDDDSSEEETTTTTTTQSETETTTTADTTEPPEETTTTTTDFSSTPDTTTTTAKPSGGSDDYTEAMTYSTNERPSFDEFEWCYGQNDLVKSAPTDAKKLDTADSIAGGWKCMLIYSQSEGGDMIAREINNVAFNTDTTGTSMLVDWYYMEIPGSEDEEEEDMDDSLFSGSFSNGVFKASETDSGLTADVKISEFWQQDGKEYAVGEITTTGGFYCYLALVRR